MNDEAIHASLQRNGDRVSVLIDRDDLEKAGITHLEYHLVPPQPPHSVIPGPDQLRCLKQDLDRSRELLEALRSRLHELRIKRNKLGSAMPAGELAELREAEEAEQKLNAELLRFEAQLRMESRLVIIDPMPQEMPK